MTAPLVCSNPQCGHSGEFHDDQTGICMASGCVCLRFWADDDGFDGEDEPEIQELDFDTDP